MDDLNKLIEAAMGGIESAPVVGPEKTVLTYIRSFGVKEGKNSVPTGRIWDHFVEVNPKSSISRQVFFRYFNTYFTPRRTGGVVFYYIDAEAVGLDSGYTVYTDLKFFRKKKEYEKARRWRKKQKQDQKRTKAFGR
jgi:hypothetical protein